MRARLNALMVRTWSPISAEAVAARMRYAAHVAAGAAYRTGGGRRRCAARINGAGTSSVGEVYLRTHGEVRNATAAESDAGSVERV